MEISLCTKKDFDQILTDFVDFWGDESTKQSHNPVYLFEFGNTAYVAKEADKVIGYLFGLFSQTAPRAYVRFVGVRQSYRRKGVARRLYEHFIRFAKTKGCKQLKAITSPTNKASIEFHRSFGMELQGEPNKDGIPIIRDYRGPGIDRVVFIKDI
jgi:GNAT superfamily N-acetyltransferase